MANLLDYIAWRGDLDFRTSPINDVDLAIFSMLVYAPFENVVPHNAVGMTISELVARFADELRLPDTTDQRKSINAMWEALGTSRRFADMRLRRFASVLDDNEIDELDRQFSAAVFTFAAGEGIDGSVAGAGSGDAGAAGDAAEEAIVAFRGTDSTVVGWREDFNLGYADPVPAQLDALDFANDALARWPRVHLCGHSKGGNLAFYAAGRAADQDRIAEAVSFDGPGLNASQLGSRGWKRVRSRARTLAPQGSIIGMLFGAGEERQLIRADGVGFAQHDIFMWHVRGTAFVAADSQVSTADVLNRGIDEFMTSTSDDERKAFVDGLFKLIDVGGATTTEEVLPLVLKTLPSVLRANAREKTSIYTDEERAALKNFMACLRRSRSAQVQEALAGLARPRKKAKADAEQGR